MVFAGDLKFLQLLYVIKMGNAKCSYPLCCATGGDRVTTSCQEHDVGADVRDSVNWVLTGPKIPNVTGSKTYLAFP